MGRPVCLEMIVEKCSFINLKNGFYMMKLQCRHEESNNGVVASVKVGKPEKLEYGSKVDVFFNSDGEPYLIFDGKNTYGNKDNCDAAN